MSASSTPAIVFARIQRQTQRETETDSRPRASVVCRLSAARHGMHNCKQFCFCPSACLPLQFEASPVLRAIWAPVGPGTSTERLSFSYVPVTSLRGWQWAQPGRDGSRAGATGGILPEASSAPPSSLEAGVKSHDILLEPAKTMAKNSEKSAFRSFVACSLQTLTFSNFVGARETTSVPPPKCIARSEKAA